VHRSHHTALTWDESYLHLAYKLCCITLSVLAAITSVIASLRIGGGFVYIPRLLAFSKFLLPPSTTSQRRELRTKASSLRHHNILVIQFRSFAAMDKPTNTNSPLPANQTYPLPSGTNWSAIREWSVCAPLKPEEKDAKCHFNILGM
jgi:hypothetical protein